MELSEAILEAAAAGRKVEAIKLVREQHGLGLKEAKAIVDSLPGSGPGVASQRSPGVEDKGVLRLVLVMFAIAVMVGLLLAISD